MMLEILGLFEEFKKNQNIKLITFQGEGKHFSFGASVPEHTKEWSVSGWRNGISLGM
jgi:enoyl-CoA hydratase/carnithine racemase